MKSIPESEPIRNRLHREAAEMLSENRLELRDYDLKLFPSLNSGGPNRKWVHAPRVSHRGKTQLKTMADATRKRTRQYTKRNSIKALLPKTTTPKRKKLVPKKYKKNLGPFPNPLGPDVIIDITMSGLGRLALESGILSKDEVRHFFDKIYTELYSFMYDYISKHTPVDTGALKIAMLNGLKPPVSITEYANVNDWDEFHLRVVLQAPIDYAGVVERMNTHPPSPYVQHHGLPHEVSWVTGKRLNDPHAWGGYYNLIRLGSRNKAQNIWKKQIKLLKFPDVGHGSVKYLQTETDKAKLLKNQLAILALSKGKQYDIPSGYVMKARNTRTPLGITPSISRQVSIRRDRFFVVRFA